MILRCFCGEIYGDSAVISGCGGAAVDGGSPGAAAAGPDLSGTGTGTLSLTRAMADWNGAALRTRRVSEATLEAAVPARPIAAAVEDQ